METGEVQLPPAAELSDAPGLGMVAAKARHRSRPHSRREARRGWGRWRPAVLYGLGSLILIAAVAKGIEGHNRLQRTNASITAMRTEWHRTLTEVSTARAHLNQATSESDAAGTALAAASDQLTAVGAQLASAQAGVRVDGVNISELDACLSGVDRALNEVSLGDQADAAASLRQVSTSCQQAEPSG
jgi:hypothetical protein